MGHKERSLASRNIEFLVRDYSKSNPNAMAKNYGVTQPTLHRIIKGEVEPAMETLEKIRDHHALPSVDVLKGIDLHQMFSQGMTLTGDNFDTVLGNRRKLPVVSWTKAVQMCVSESHYLSAEAEGYVEPRDSKPSERAFALRIKGDSMTASSPGPHNFPEGSVVIFDPEKKATPGMFVLAKDAATQEATFKRLVEDGGRYFLRPLNPAYPTVQIDDPAVRVIAVAVECQLITKL